MLEANRSWSPTVIERMETLVEQAKQGEPDATGQLQQVLDEHPEIWRHFGDLAGHSERGWVELLAGNSSHVRESLLRQTAAMRTELAGPQPSALEALLVDDVVISWIQVRYFELVSAAYRTEQVLTPREAESVSKQQDAAQRRHLAAIRALAQTQKLLGSSKPVSGAVRYDETAPFLAVV